jgi:hypothetical protein
MRGRPILTVALCGLVAGCDSNLNPVNWFGGEEADVALAGDGVPADLLPRIDQITGVVLEPVPGGIILRATGLAATMGYWNAALVPVDPDLRPDENGVLAFDFQALPPPAPQPQGRAAAREIVTGQFLTAQTLREVRVIRVQAERNARDIRP